MNLLAGVHDPEGRMVTLVPFFKNVISQFDSTVLSITPNTSPEMKKSLQDLGVTLLDANANAGQTRKDLLARAKGVVLMSDFDKLVHQQKFYPEEISQMSKLNPEGLLILGRTKEGFASCPPSWTETELIVNQTAAKVFGLTEIDICCGPFITNERNAAMLYENAKNLEGWSCLPEYPLIAKRNGVKIEFMSLMGLEWEDPDRYEKEIAIEGYKSWIKRIYDSPQEWEKRRQASEVMLRVLTDFSAGIERKI